MISLDLSRFCGVWPLFSAVQRCFCSDLSSKSCFEFQNLVFQDWKSAKFPKFNCQPVVSVQLWRLCEETYRQYFKGVITSRVHKDLVPKPKPSIHASISIIIHRKSNGNVPDTFGNCLGMIHMQYISVRRMNRWSGRCVFVLQMTPWDLLVLIAAMVF